MGSPPIGPAMLLETKKPAVTTHAVLVRSQSLAEQLLLESVHQPLHLRILGMVGHSSRHHHGQASVQCFCLHMHMFKTGTLTARRTLSHCNRQAKVGCMHISCWSLRKQHASLQPRCPLPHHMLVLTARAAPSRARMHPQTSQHTCSHAHMQPKGPGPLAAPAGRAHRDDVGGAELGALVDGQHHGQAGHHSLDDPVRQGPVCSCGGPSLPLFRLSGSPWGSSAAWWRCLGMRLHLHARAWLQGKEGAFLIACCWRHGKLHKRAAWV